MHFWSALKRYFLCQWEILPYTATNKFHIWLLHHLHTSADLHFRYLDPSSFFYEWNFIKSQAPEIQYAAWAANKQKQSKRLEHRTEHRTEHHKDTAGQLKLQQKQTTKNTRKSSQKLKLIKQKQLEATSCIKNRGWKLP